jgi:ABC-2 type transport system permease protein
MDSSKGKYAKFCIYLLAVVLLNIAGMTLFFRLDLTAGGAYSLSTASRQVVSSLSEPLTVKVFFTPNLPAPHNGTERYLEDLLAEYRQANTRYFNFQMFDLSGDETEQGRRNRELAESYGIFPVQIQNIEQDEVKFQKAYMGLVMIHGDVVEKVPTVLGTDGLEYTITSAIRKMNNKISVLLGLKGKVDVAVYLSSSLTVVGPYMNLNALDQLPGQVRGIVEDLNRQNYGKLAFVHRDPTVSPEASAEADRYGLRRLSWEPFTDSRGKAIPGGEGVADLVIRYGDDFEQLPLIRVVQLPIFGTTYQLTEKEALESAINEALASLVNINEAVGYLADHGSRPLAGPRMPGGAGEPMTNFDRLLRNDYTVKTVSLKEGGLIPDGLESLIIAGPTEPFSDYALYQIDQFLMRGKNLAIYLDPFKEEMPGGQNQMMMRQGPVFTPVKTGLEKLLAHYGVSIKNAYALDEESFEQRIPQQFGGGVRKLYFAPIIQSENISQDAPFMRNLKGLVMLKVAPLSLSRQRVKEQGLAAEILFSTTDKAWEMTSPINLNPMMLAPPGEDEKRGRKDLAVMLEGPFESYFAGKPIPEKPVPEKKDDGETEQTAPSDGPEKPAVEPGTFQASGATLTKGKPGRILLIGSAEILTNSIMDEEGRTPNAQMVMNGIDALNGREAYAVLRSKTQQYNPLQPTSPGTRTFVKAFNIVGLPVLVILAGLLIWMRRTAKKRAIQQMFAAGQ